jgi:hypothetical protein
VWEPSSELTLIVRGLTKESRACLLKYNELDKFDFVDGPMMADIYKGIPHNPIKYQLASKTAKSDALLNECLVGVIWLHKASDIFSVFHSRHKSATDLV